MLRHCAFPLVALLALAACKPENQPRFDAPASDAAASPSGVTAMPTAGATATASTAAALLATCPDYPFVNGEELARTRPLPVPAALAGILASDRDHFAVAALGGGTVCVDTRSMERIAKPALSADRRFLSWDWDGMEAFGHVIVDRIGKGTSIDTGVAPVASPSGRRLAAVDWSESAFGALNAFAVWDTAPAGLRLLGQVEAPPAGYTDWKVDGWRGEDCVVLSALTFAQSAESAGAAKRTAFAATPSGAGEWRVGPAAASPCPAR